MSATQPIHVLHCIDTLGRGGAETLLLDLCNMERSSEVELHLIATGSGELEHAFCDSGVAFTRRDRQGPLDLSLVRFIREYCELNDIDVVHGHQPVSSLHALLATHGTDIAVVHSIHGFTEDIKNKLVFKAILGHTNANILVSESMRTMLLESEWVRDIPKARVVYNGVDESKLRFAPTDLRSECQLPEDAILIGMVGNIYNVKDHLTLCCAMPEIVRSNARIHCVIAGRIDDASIYKQCQAVLQSAGVQDHVHFLGGRSDAPGILRSLDAFVFSTRKDTFGLALIEAMLVGVPCIASDIAVMNEISCEGALATLFRQGDPRSLAKAVISHVQAPAVAQKMARAAKSYAQQHYSITAHRDALITVYRSVSRMNAVQELSTHSRYITHVPLGT